MIFPSPADSGQNMLWDLTLPLQEDSKQPPDLSVKFRLPSYLPIIYIPIQHLDTAGQSFKSGGFYSVERPEAESYNSTYLS